MTMKCVQPSLPLRSWTSLVPRQSPTRRRVPSALRFHAEWACAAVADDRRIMVREQPSFRWICCQLVSWTTTYRRCHGQHPARRQPQRLLRHRATLRQQRPPLRQQRRPPRRASQRADARALQRRLCLPQRLRLRQRPLQRQPQRQRRRNQPRPSRRERRPRQGSNVARWLPKIVRQPATCARMMTRSLAHQSS